MSTPNAKALSTYDWTSFEAIARYVWVVDVAKPLHPKLLALSGLYGVVGAPQNQPQ